MAWDLPPSEREYLRELAKRQAEYAALPVMGERKQMWYDLNEGKPGARPPVVVESWTFDRDFMPAGAARCESGVGRGIEWQLLRNIRQHELIDDDHVVPDTFQVGWHASTDMFGGLAIPTESVKDAQGIETGYHFLHPITNLERDFELLGPAICGVDREATAAYEAFVSEVLGDILPVRLSAGPFGNRGLTQAVVRLMGMEAFFTAMYDTPELMHRLMAYLRDNVLTIMHWAEAEGLYRLNNGNDESFGSSYNFTRELPQADYAGGPVRLCDLWGSAESQETVGVSPELFHEFCFPYYREVVEPLGLVYYGCCEPAHPFWGDLEHLPHLKKISISRWCDQPFMGEALRGTGIVFSRKPDPNFLSVDPVLDEEAWAAHIRETLEATRGVGLEFIVRDVYTVHGNLANPHRAVEIARREIERFGAR